MGAGGLSLCAGEFLEVEALDFSSPSLVPISQEEACLSVSSVVAGLYTGKGGGESMGFTQNQAEAKRGKRVRVRDGSLSLYGIAKGTTGKVVDCEVAGLCQMGGGPGSTTGRKKEEGWAVVVQFDVRRDAMTYPIEKEQYEHSLEEI